MKKFFDYPLAVYVGTFADGRVARLSVGARKGKVDFDRARGMICRMWREGALPHHSTPADKWGYARPLNADDTPYRTEQYWSAPDRTDLIAGHVEHDGATTIDPFFFADNVIPLPKRRAARKINDPVDAVLSALGELSLSDLESFEALIAEMINEKLAA
jgi:hypothetical protein